MTTLIQKARCQWNRLRHLSAYYRRTDTTNAHPFAFEVEPTNYCNLECPMCPHDLMTRKVGYMDLGLYRAVVDEIKPYSSSLRLHNMGESLFHKEVDQFIRIARDNGLRTILSTNATALNQKTGTRILDAGLDQLLISFDGSSKETYEHCRKGAKYERVLVNIERFFALRRSRRANTTRVTLSLINMPITHGEIETFRTRWKDDVDAVRIKQALNWDGSSQRINQMVELPVERAQMAPCFHPWSSMVILWDGRVVPCCMDYDAKLVLGNVQEKSLTDIFNDTPMRELRRLHTQGRTAESALCRGCAWDTGGRYPLTRFLGDT